MPAPEPPAEPHEPGATRPEPQRHHARADHPEVAAGPRAVRAARASDPAAGALAGLTPRMVFRWAVAAGLGLLAVALGALAIYSVRGVIVLAVVALFIAVSLDPAVRWLIRHGWRRGWAVALIFVLALLALAGAIAAITPALIREARQLASDLPGYFDAWAVRYRPVQDLLERFRLAGQVQEFVRSLPGRIGANVLGFVSSVFGAVFSALTVAVLTIYFMVDLPRLRRGVVRLFPAPNRPRVRQTVDVTVDKVGSYMFGNVVISLIAGTASFIALTVVRAPFALPLAVVIAVTDLIPMIGATLGAVITFVVTALAAELWPTAIIVLVFLILYQQVENYYIAPRILRNAVDLPAVAVLLAGLIGGSILGLVGALMAIPIAAVVKVLASVKIRQMDAAERAAGRRDPGDRAEDSARGLEVAPGGDPDAVDETVTEPDPEERGPEERGPEERRPEEPSGERAEPS